MELKIFCRKKRSTASVKSVNIRINFLPGWGFVFRNNRKITHFNSARHFQLLLIIFPTFLHCKTHMRRLKKLNLRIYLLMYVYYYFFKVPCCWFCLPRRHGNVCGKVSFDKQRNFFFYLCYSWRLICLLYLFFLCNKLLLRFLLKVLNQRNSKRK